MHRSTKLSNLLRSMRLVGPTRNDRSGRRRSIRLIALEHQPLEVRLALSASVATTVMAPPDGSYTAGQSLEFRIKYDQPVTVAGTPTLKLTIGKTVRAASYFAGSESNELSFRYVVQAGDNDADGVAIARRIALPGGAAITTSSNQPAKLELCPANTSHVRVDTLAPNIMTVGGPAAKPYSAGSILSFTVRLSEPVIATGTPTLPIEIGGSVRNAFWNAQGSGTNLLTFTTVVKAGDLDTDGVRVIGPIWLSVGSTIRDTAGNGLGIANAATSFPKVTVDAAAPELSTISVVSVTPRFITLKASFSEPVNVQGKPVLPFTLGGQQKTATYAGGSGSESLTFSYRQSVNPTTGRDQVVASQLLELPAGALIQDKAGNHAQWSAKLESDDIFQLEWASDPQISPDGSQLVYVRNSNDIMTDSSRRSIWLVDLATGEQHAILSGKASYSQPRWSPDGRQVAFLSIQSGKSEIHLYTIASGKDAQLSQLDGSPSALTWSPDGSRLAFTMDVAAPATAFVSSVALPTKPVDAKWADPADVYERAYYQADGQGFLTSAYQQIFVVSAGGGSARQLTSGSFDYGNGLIFTPDGNGIVFSANLSADWEYQPCDSDLYRLDIAGGQLTQLTTLAGTETEPVFSPDGQRLAFIWTTNNTVPYRLGKLKVLQIGQGAVSDVTPQLDLDLTAPDWFNNNEVLVQYDDHGYRKVGKLSLADGSLTTLLDQLSGVGLAQPYLSGGYQYRHGMIAFTSGNAQRPADVALWQPGGQVRRLTALNEDLLGHKKLGEVHEIQYQSLFDGQQIQAWYITPPDFDPTRKYPLMVEIHGGPHLSYGPHFSAEMQRLAAEGYVVFYDNYRGSSGYGEQFGLLLKNYSSSEDYADHDSGVNAMIAKGFIEDRNLFISGGSAGGTATAYAIGLTDRYRAAAVFKPVINWTSKVLTGDTYLYQTNYQFPGPPWDNFLVYWQRSPLSLAGNMKTPTMVMTGEDDRRTPISESEQLYEALRFQKVPAALLRIPGATHAFTNRPSRMISKIQYTLAWFALYRQP